MTARFGATVPLTFVRSAVPSQRALATRTRFLSTSSVLRAEPTATPASPSAAPSPAAAPSSSTTRTLSPKLESIVDEISKLTLLEAADLVDALKSRLNIVDIAMPAASAAPAAAATGAGGDAGAASEEAAKPKEKTVFTVNLTKIDAAQKAKAIREVKAIMPGMNLVEAKKFVESLPKTLKEGATKDEAEKLQALFKGIGAEVALD
ncbi:hypothetical protein JCM10212_005240 [Sporobolomyces blumeae]